MATTIQNGVIVSTVPTNILAFRYQKQHQNQELAFFPGALLLFANAMLQALSLNQLPREGLRTLMLLHFVGIMIGAAAASFLLHKLKKSIHYYLSAALTIISAILCLISPHDIEMTEGANFMAGLSFGIVLLTTLIHASEVSIKYLRGIRVFNIQFMIDSGILMYWLVGDMEPIVYYLLGILTLNNTVIGIIMIVIAAVSILWNIFFGIESPYFLFEIGDDAQAKSNLLRLRKETGETLEIINDLNEMKLSVNENSPILGFNDLRTFFKVFLIRFGYVLSISLPVNCLLLGAFVSLIDRTNFAIWFAIFRCFGGIIGTFSLAKLHSRINVIISFGVSGLILIIITCLTMGDVPDLDQLKLAGGLTIIYQLTGGFGAGGISLNIMSEAFGSHNKTYLNAAIIILDSLIHIIIIVTYENLTIFLSNAAFMFIASISQIIVCAFMIFIMPDTYRKSLKVARELYR